MNPRIIILTLCLLQPVIAKIIYPDLYSLSSVWETPLRPAFIIINIAASYYLFEHKIWKLPAILLLLLTAFDLVDYELIHNIISAAFFISCAYPLFKHRYLRFTGLLYVIGTLTLIISRKLFIGEIWGIMVICSHHLLILNYKNYLKMIK